MKAFSLLIATFYVFNLAYPKANTASCTFYRVLESVDSDLVFSEVLDAAIYERMQRVHEMGGKDRFPRI